MYTAKIPVGFETVQEGRVIERANQLLESAIKNCLDLSYDQSTRKVTVTLRITPNQRRDEVVCIPEFAVTQGKLRMPAVGMAIGIGSHGRPEAREFIERQQALFEASVTPIRKTDEGGE